MAKALDFGSIILGIAATSQVVSFNRLLRNRSLVRWDWLALATALLILLTLVRVWWGLAATSSGTITIGRFLPEEVPAVAIDLAAYYHEQSGQIWFLFTLIFGWHLAVETVPAASQVRSAALLLLDRSGEMLILALTATLVVVRRRWWHGAVLEVLTVPVVGWLTRAIG